MALATLSVDLVAKLAKFEADLGAAARASEKSAQQIGRAMDGARAAVTSLGGAIAGVLSAGAVVGAIKSSADYADQIGKLSQKIGIATEDISGLAYAAKLSDVSNEALSTGIKKLSTLIAEGGEKFKYLGINIKDAQGNSKDTLTVFAEVADRFAGMEVGAEKTALAVALFGKSGSDLIPLLNQGAAGIKAATDEARRFGLIVSKEAAAAAEQFNDNMTRLRASTQGATVAIAGPFIKVLGESTEAMLRAAEQGGRLAGLVALIQGLATGSDQQKNDKTLVDLTEKLLRAEKILQAARSADKGTAGYEQRVKQRQDYVNQLKEELKTTTAMRDVLGQEAKAREAAAAAIKKAQEAAAARVDVKGLLNDSAKSAREAADKARQADFKVVETRNKLVEESAKAAAKAEEDVAKARAAASAQAAKYIESLAAQNTAQLTSNQALAKEIEEMGLSTEALERLRLSRLDANIAREQEILLQARNIEGNDAEVKQIERRIELLQKERDLTVTRAAKRVQVEMRQVGDQAREDIYQATSAGLAQALREGRNPIKGFADALGNAVLDKVSRSLADALLDPILGKNGIFSVGISSFFSSFKFADGGIMTGAGPVPLKSYANGGIANTRQIAEFGEGDMPEAFVPLPDGRRIPVALKGGAGGGNITIINNYTVGDVATKATVQQAVAGSERRMVETIERRQKYGGSR